MAREAGGVFDDDDADGVAHDALEQGGKAWAALYRVLAAYGLVAKLVYDLKPSALSKGGDRVALAFLAIQVWRQ